jgi:hypothetical protein
MNRTNGPDEADKPKKKPKERPVDGSPGADAPDPPKT